VAPFFHEKPTTYTIPIIAGLGDDHVQHHRSEVGSDQTNAPRGGFEIVLIVVRATAFPIAGTAYPHNRRE